MYLKKAVLKKTIAETLTEMVLLFMITLISKSNYGSKFLPHDYHIYTYTFIYIYIYIYLYIHIYMFQYKERYQCQLLNNRRSTITL